METINLLGETEYTRQLEQQEQNEFVSVWSDEDARITVRFKNGRVAETSFERLQAEDADQ